MKRNRLAALPISLLMACLLSVSAIGALISGMALPVERMDWIFLACCICALVSCVIFLFKRGWIAALILASCGFAWLWQAYYLSEPIRALITRLSWYYDSAYGWGMLEFAGVNWREVTLDLPLAVWGCCIALSAARTMMQSRWLGLTVLLTLLPVCATVVVTNTVPAPAYLYLLMLGLLLLLLSATVRQQDPAQGAVLTAITALPVALLLGLLFHFCPKDTYVNRSEEYLDNMVSWWQNTATFSFDNTGLISQAPAAPNASATANLSRVGPRNTWGYTVMEAEADYSGTVYLRGQDFDRYDGVSWNAIEDRTEVLGAPSDHGAWTYDGEISIRTATPSNVLYLPYYPTEEQPLEGGRTKNTENLREYHFGVRHPLRTEPDRGDGFTHSLGTFSQPAGTLPQAETPAQRYTQLPSDTRRWAVAYLNEHFASDLLYNSPDYTIARAIADHVRASAVYDTGTPRMSGDYEDFVQWFLEASDTGYCVHFASAATVLLRAAGVPARYVTGYMFTAKADETVEVTANQAHAWVEYYHQELNTWIVLEATPADLSEEETEPPETQPEETDPPTEASTGEEGETRPDDERPGSKEEDKRDLTWLWTILKWLLLPAALWLAVMTQYGIRRNLHRAGRNPNARALAYWQDAEALCRFTGQTPPEDLKALAQKAKFSQHTLTAEELNIFRTWLKEQRQKLKEKPWYQRFVYRYILALW